MNLAPASASARGVESCCTLLTETYTRLSALSPTLGLHIVPAPSGIGQDWAALGELARHPQILDVLLEAETARHTGRYGTAQRPDVVASRVLHRLLWSTCLLLSGPWYLQRRVPRLRPQDVRISRRDEACQVVPGGFACLPDDPAASLPGAVVLPDQGALDQELRTAASDQARLLIAALGPRLRRGPRALWGMAEDDLVAGIWHLGRATGDEEKAVAAAGELLPAPVPPFPAGAGFRRLHGGDGTSYPTRTRTGCCLFYAISPGEACATCPRTGDADRLARIGAG
ncbi:iron-sulfur protein [Streptomyces abyssalis]|uniref:Iron-sulfur protein n=1 Tax=Streptomyces abyssalis TaxID=933944 RepID=A0A1E7JN62_9ACTN|nr:(2Fe-2S)-binding protein [Streptomyces abyssalis]OEU86930.1 iron-sulfur protein [Streptomyces abyssalis]OEU89685.1 iron-sulfur protein [Streptomyces abyssalis]OEV31295.1 iron-sulfur protein [Streptomyces nanshensis]